MASNVPNLILEAARTGSLAQLNQVRHSNNWLAIPIDLIVKCDSRGGKTPLQVAVDNGHYHMVEFLVAELKYQIYPKWKKTMMASSSSSSCSWSWSSLGANPALPPAKKLSLEMQIVGQVSVQVPVAKLIEYLVVDPVRDDEPFQWLDFLLHSFVASRLSASDKIVALELMGCAFVFQRQQYVWRGLQCWQQAVALRQSTLAGGGGLPTLPPCVRSAASRGAFSDRVQAMASPLAFQRFQEDWRHGYSHVDVQVQGLLISERIWSASGQARPNAFHLANLMRYGRRCCHEGRHYDRAFNVSLLIREELAEFGSTSSAKCVAIFAAAVDLMLHSLRRAAGSRADGQLSPAHFLLVLRFGLDILSRLADAWTVVDTRVDDWQLDLLETVYNLILDHHSVATKPAHTDELHLCLAHYFRANNNARRSSTSLLHLAIAKVDVMQRCPDRVLPAVQLFLAAGADPTAADGDGKSPLHLLAENYDRFRLDVKPLQTVFERLLDAGGRLDQTTADGKTFATILREQRTQPSVSGFGFQQPTANALVPLSCVCARIIRQAKIPFEHRLPASMHLFVRRHSALPDESLLIDWQSSSSCHC